MLALLGGCALEPATGASAPRAPAESTPAGFCGSVAALADRSCLARYNCAASAGAIATLRAGQCACRSGALVPERAQALADLLRRTPAYACCTGIPLARGAADCGD